MNRTWRRRKCEKCKGVFTTLEGVDFPVTLLFKASLTHVEPFRRDELFTSIYESCKHIKDAVATASALTDTVLRKLLPKINHASLERKDVIGITASVLHRYDQVAESVYLAYHPIQ